MTVLEIGARTVHASSGTAPDPALVEAALDWIDDPVGLYRDRPVRVSELWRALIADAAGEQTARIVIVHPDHWPPHRVDRVLAAADEVTDDVDAVRCSAWSPPADTTATPRRRTRGAAVGACLGIVAAVAGVLILQSATGSAPAAWTTVVEGRLAVRLPEDWTVVRVTTGPGSRRLEATSPQNRADAVHITQSYAPETTLAEAADVLARAIAAEPAGVFVDFRSDAEVAGRPAITYREVRPGRIVDWAVVMSGATRISVGCQGKPGGESEVRAVCEQVMRTAGESGTNPAG